MIPLGWKLLQPMKILITSDIHANQEALAALPEDCDEL